jgi:hypothetical protein
MDERLASAWRRQLRRALLVLVVMAAVLGLAFMVNSIASPPTTGTFSSLIEPECANGGVRDDAATPSQRFPCPVSSSQALVTVFIQNVGTNASSPTCDIRLRSPDGADMGGSVLPRVGTIAPGDTVSVVDSVDVSNRGAASVAYGTSSVHCT